MLSPSSFALFTTAVYRPFAANVFAVPEPRTRLREGPNGPKPGARCYLELWPAGERLREPYTLSPMSRGSIASSSSASDRVA